MAIGQSVHFSLDPAPIVKGWADWINQGGGPGAPANVVVLKIFTMSSDGQFCSFSFGTLDHVNVADADIEELAGFGRILDSNLTWAEGSWSGVANFENAPVPDGEMYVRRADESVTVFQPGVKKLPKKQFLTLSRAFGSSARGFMFGSSELGEQVMLSYSTAKGGPGI